MRVFKLLIFIPREVEVPMVEFWIIISRVVDTLLGKLSDVQVPVAKA